MDYRAGKRVAGPVDRGTKPLAVSSVVQESERTIYPQLKVCGIIYFAIVMISVRSYNNL